ncbi:MAG: hypothetical protein H0X51_03425 [Parachlamydiaceae bacterium]|nr:hypothetical protein [Parachlamydiaceae bacterium]
MSDNQLFNCAYFNTLDSSSKENEEYQYTDCFCSQNERVNLGKGACPKIKRVSMKINSSYLRPNEHAVRLRTKQKSYVKAQRVKIENKPVFVNLVEFEENFVA